MLRSQGGGSESEILEKRSRIFYLRLHNPGARKQFTRGAATDLPPTQHLYHEHPKDFFQVGSIADFCGGSVAGIFIALKYLGKHKRKMAIRGIKLAEKQQGAIELTR